MNQTEHYQLNQWEMTDRIRMEDFNADNAKIEAALQTETAARTGAIAALNAAMAKLGNCILYTSSYVGTGVQQQMTLTFPKPPVLVYVGAPKGGYHIDVIQGMTFCQNGDISERYNLTWSGNSLSWQTGSNPIIGLNASGMTYAVAALLDAGT